MPAPTDIKITMDGEDSPSPYRITTTLRRTERSLAAALEAALSAAGLTAAQFHVLEELTVTTVLHAGELAWRHRVTRQSMHGIVPNLADAGLVEVAPKEQGLRNIWLTTGGRERLVLARQTVSEIERRVGTAVAPRGRRPLDPAALRDRPLAGGRTSGVVVGLIELRP